MKLNKIDDPKKLQIGQVLKVPAKAPKTPESIAFTIYHISCWRGEAAAPLGR